MFHSVIMATKGRSSVLEQTMLNISQQDYPPDEIIISATEDADVCGLKPFVKMKLIFGDPGICIQLNTAIHALSPESDLVTFLDDDVELAPKYFSFLRSYMDQHPEVAGASGVVLLDGATRQEAQDAILRHVPNYIDKPQDARSFYGCNMNFRRSILSDELFDERLKLYSWLADFDFSVRIAKKGRLMIIPKMFLCHLKTPSGRMSHKRFGFVQIMHAWYLHKKGFIGRKELWKDHLLPGVVANILKLLLDPGNRIQRIKGNLFALQLILRGVAEPEALEKMSV